MMSLDPKWASNMVRMEMSRLGRTATFLEHIEANKR